MAWAPVVMMGVSLVSGLMQSKADQEAASNNAAIQRANAEQARIAASIKADQIREDGVRSLKNITAQNAASGFTLSGSALDVLFEQARQTERQAQLAVYEGQVKSTFDLAQAAETERSAAQRKQSALLGLAGKTVSSVYGINNPGSSNLLGS